MVRAITVMLMFLASPMLSRAEEYVLRIDSLDLVRELDGRLESHLRSDEIDLKNERETITESIEVKVRVGERFYGKTIRGPKVFEIRGQVKPSEHPNQITLEIEAAEYLRTGEWIKCPDGQKRERTEGRRVQSTTILAMGQPFHLARTHSVKFTPDPLVLRCHDFWAIVNVVQDVKS